MAISHTNCGHPATRSARAACRRERARHESKGTRQPAVTASRTNPKRLKATNGERCSAAELHALRNVASRDCPAIPSNVTCRAIRAKGFAYWNVRHNIWMLTPIGQELIERPTKERISK